MNRVTAWICLVASLAGSSLLADDDFEDFETTQWAPIVVALKGDVHIRRKGWKGWAPVRFGTSIHAGDLLRTGATSSVEVICSDLRREVVRADEIFGAPCKTRPELISSQYGVLTPTRNEDPEAGRRMVLLSPRWTGILDGRPTIRWSAPAGVRRFEVTIRTAEGVQWTKHVESSLSLSYPSDVSPLRAGNQYSIVITAGVISSTRDGEAWPIFVVASVEQAAKAKKLVQSVHALKLSAEKTRVLEAKVLATLGLYAAAVDRLEQSPLLEEAAAERILGSTYRAIGLNRLAIDRYRKAMAQSAKLGDSDGEVLAVTALGSLCQSFGLCAQGEAQRHLKRAVSLYEALGAAKDVRRLRDQLAAYD